MDFEAVSLATAPKAVREGTYTDELKAEVAEAWEAQQKLGDGYALRASFKDQEVRDLWLKKAQAYGKTQDLFVSKARSIETEDNVLAFTIQVESVRQGRIKAREERARLGLLVKEAGYVIPRGMGATKAINDALQAMGRDETV